MSGHTLPYLLDTVVGTEECNTSSCCIMACGQDFILSRCALKK